jgi:hypothetical protein
LWFFTRNTPQIFAPPSTIGKNMIFLRKIVIFHTKYPKIFAPPSARRNFFRFANKQAIYRLGIISLAHAPVHVTDFPVVNVHVDEFGSKNCMPHCPQT